MSNELTISDLTGIVNGMELKPEVRPFNEQMREYMMKPDNKRIFGDYIYDNEVTLIAGQTGSGKSMFCYQLADSISKGIPLMNEENELPPSRVIYYDYEMKDHQIKKRYHGLEINENFLRADTREINLNNNNFDFSVIDRHINLYLPKVVIIDNIGILSNESVQDQRTALNIMKTLYRNVVNYEIAFIVVTHTPKIKDLTRPLTIADIEGSAKLTNYADSAIIIGKSQKEKDIRYLKDLKARNNAENELVKTMEIMEEPYLHFESMGYTAENDHLQANMNDKERKNDLIEIVDTIIGSGQIRYNDFCSKYADHYSKSIANGKKIIETLSKYNLVVKDNGYYIKNLNESGF